MKNNNNYSRTPEYKSWSHMKDRCLNIKNKSYKNYGGRGITVCKEWLESFFNFLNDMGCKPSKEYSLGRINNDGNYEKNNCEWQTTKEQSCNTRKNKIIIYKGEKVKALDIIPQDKKYIYRRINKNMDIEKALNTPHHIKKFFIDDEYLTKNQIEEKYKIKKATFAKRVALGWSVDDAAKKPLVTNEPLPKSKYKILYNYKVYTLDELAKYHNINYDILRGRYYSGKYKNIEDCLK
jgi:hypothetical protein